MGTDQEREKEQAGCGVGWARQKLTVLVLQGSRAMAERQAGTGINTDTV